MLQPTGSPIYDNCLVFDVQGNTLFRCDAKKMQWYLSRNLAEKISDAPPQIRLLFETAGPGHIGDPFFLEKRQNVCVVCGTGHDLTRHHILPHCYRRFFPRNLDRFGTYDVMALCVEHHHNYEHVANELRRKLADVYNAPVNGVGGRSCPDTGRAVRAAWALLRYRDKLPKPKLSELERRVSEFFGALPSHEVLMELTQNNRTTVKTHAEMVVEKLQDLDTINHFVIMWRKHFIETMEPKFLPDHWDVERQFRPG